MRLHYFGAVLLAGCGDPVPETTEYDDVARMAGATIATPEGGATLGAVNDSILLAFGGMPAGFTFENGLIYGDHGGLEHEYTMVACRDLENQLIKPCNQLTNTATLVASWSGSVEQPGLELWSSRQGMWTLSSLQTWMPKVTGSSGLQIEGLVEGRRYQLTATETEAMVTPGYAMGGSIRLELVVTDPVETTMAADVVFDDLTRSAALTIDGEHLYRVDLTTGAVDK